MRTYYQIIKKAGVYMINNPNNLRSIKKRITFAFCVVSKLRKRRRPSTTVIFPIPK